MNDPARPNKSNPTRRSLMTGALAVAAVGAAAAVAHAETPKPYPVPTPRGAYC